MRMVEHNPNDLERLFETVCSFAYGALQMLLLLLFLTVGRCSRGNEKKIINNEGSNHSNGH